MLFKRKREVLLWLKAHITYLKFILIYLRESKVLELSSIFGPSFFEIRLHFFHLRCQTYEIYKVYEDAGISAKNDKRPAYQEKMQDVKDKKINVIVAFKLDRLTRSVYDIEKLMKFVNDYECDIDCMADELNTNTSNGRMVMIIMNIVY